MILMCFVGCDCTLHAQSIFKRKLWQPASPLQGPCKPPLQVHTNLQAPPCRYLAGTLQVDLAGPKRPKRGACRFWVHLCHHGVGSPNFLWCLRVSPRLLKSIFVPLDPIGVRIFRTHLQGGALQVAHTWGHHTYFAAAQAWQSLHTCATPISKPLSWKIYPWRCALVNP